jgi:hypothetical protein
LGFRRSAVRGSTIKRPVAAAAATMIRPRGISPHDGATAARLAPDGLDDDIAAVCGIIIPGPTAT